MENQFKDTVAIVPGGSFRIGGAGVHNPTTRWNTSDDIQYRKN